MFASLGNLSFLSAGTFFLYHGGTTVFHHTDRICLFGLLFARFLLQFSQPDEGGFSCRRKQLPGNPQKRRTSRKNRLPEKSREKEGRKKESAQEKNSEETRNKKGREKSGPSRKQEVPPQPLIVEPGPPPRQLPPLEEPATNEVAIGTVTHYYSHLNVAVVQINKGRAQDRGHHPHQRPFHGLHPNRRVHGV